MKQGSNGNYSPVGSLLKLIVMDNLIHLKNDPQFGLDPGLGLHSADDPQLGHNPQLGHDPHMPFHGNHHH
jgi:hypothetical protein